MLGRTSRVMMMAALAVGACGGKPAPAPAAPTREPVVVVEAQPPVRVAAADSREDPGGGGGGGDDEDGLEVSSTRGSIDPAVVSDKLQPKASAIEACYSTQVGRRKWLGGGIELAWEVAADGRVTAVRLASSDLGAWPIERCVLGVARGIGFGKPRGAKPARVSAPINFSAGVGAVRWDEKRADKAVSGKLAKLASCTPAGEAAPADLAITLYLGTRGKVQSVGFASPGGFSEAWADCAEKAIMAWSLTDPRGKVAKLTVTLNPSGGADL